MTYKIVADSSANMIAFDGVDFATVPLKIITSQKEYVDTPELSVGEMVSDLRGYSGKSSTSCPNVGEWIEAFGDADRVFAITITSKLSGSYASAVQAKEQYEQEYPDRRVYVVDTLSTGGTMVLVAEKIRELLAEGADYDKICAEIPKYLERNELFFLLKSMRNLGNNGRVNPTIAKIAGVLGINVLGIAREGTIALLHKCRNQPSAMKKILSSMKEMGYKGGKVAISHTLNLDGANELFSMILREFPNAKVSICENRGLCSYYAEQGGIIIGFEKEI